MADEANENSEQESPREEGSGEATETQGALPRIGLLGRKLGMTQVIDSDGQAVAVTVVQVGPCVVVQRKTPERDGYSAIQLGLLFALLAHDEPLDAEVVMSELLLIKEAPHHIGQLPLPVELCVGAL